ncbi:galactose mutarotase-like enzyme [Lactobacillus colini]|uniref:Galactose mutarotase-like enzyme n=1 Tax=Lactobacillus colini TaxID=1819254 RepID=A0ABS4MCJ2_9LACO|nr:aldose 1-epimerase family protein [Lactobacillus colini]MBP2057398.1 galactose mutarotase-like enzyme [Lactobacillus colini]
MLTIENSQLKVEINELGAQVTHVIDKRSNYDCIWNGSEWEEHSPILFPAVGKSNGNQCVIDGKKYPMMPNGFANNYSWTVVDKGDDRASLILTHNEETLKSYPFKFSLMVTYLLVANQLQVAFRLTNDSDTEMPYSLGIMPAFSLPLEGEKLDFYDYELRFVPEIPDLTQFHLDKEGLRSLESTSVAGVNNGVLNLQKAVFDYGHILINSPGLTAIELISNKSDSGHAITVTLEGFNGVEIWKSPDTNKFLAIAPINGFPDVLDQTSAWGEKLGNKVLPAGANIDFKTNITFQ